MAPERFSDNAFDTVATRREAAMLLGYRKPQSRLSIIAGAKQHGEHFVPAAFGVFEDPAIGRGVGEAAFWREALVAACGVFEFAVRGSRLRALLALWRKLRSPFRAAAL